ncbi:hypothetical protein GLOIN_2v1769820 [Rhizophagus irregularis DAOM 181602=DAOM 197198]|nr:hypothetical protein GLOIN_2v1769820 [Rhizophagus irregularis DAOM 181602=DAOM 197198]
MSFKKHYRYFHIHWMLKQVEAGERTQDLKMSILQAIQYIIQDFPLDDHEVSDELANALKTLNFSDMMELKEFFNIPEENMKKLFKDQYSKDKAEPSHKLSDSKEDSEEDSEILNNEKYTFSDNHFSELKKFVRAENEESASLSKRKGY